MPHQQKFSAEAVLVLVEKYLDRTEYQEEVDIAWRQHIAEKHSQSRYEDVKSKIPMPHHRVRYQALQLRARRTHDPSSKLRKLNQRWYELEHGDWRPLLDVYEVPVFLWNLWLGRLSRDRPTQLARFETLATSLCIGFARDDARSMFAQFTRLGSPGNETRAIASSSQAISCYPQCQQSRLEQWIRNSYTSKLETFKQDLRLRQNLKQCSTIFDTSISRMLLLLGDRSYTHWGSYATSCDSEDACDYIATTALSLERYLLEEHTLRPVPHVIRDSLRPQADINGSFLNVLCLKTGQSTIEVQNLAQAPTAPLNRRISKEELQNRHESRSNDDFDPAPFSDHKLPLNLLDLHGTGFNRPNLLPASARYQGISLGHQWANATHKGVGKSSFTSKYPADSYAMACSDFELFALRGASSGAHIDFLGQTQITCLSGIKAWLVCTLPLDSEHSDVVEFCQQGPEWCPKDKFKLILLRAGDTLIMPPGALIIHAPITIEDSLMAGGMFIDLHLLPWLGKVLSFVVNNDQVTNEFLPADICKIWDVLTDRVRQDSGAFGIPGNLQDNFGTELDVSDRELRRNLSCCCAENRPAISNARSAKSAGKAKRVVNCGTGCPCRTRMIVEGHCTVWCSRIGKKACCTKVR